MSVYKFLSITIVLTMAALVYVTQQTSLVRLSYDIKNKEGRYSELLDRNRILLYNVKYLESPVRLEKELAAKNMKLEVPSKEKIILVSASVPQSTVGVVEKERTDGVFRKIRQTTTNILALGPEAQAKPLDKNTSKK